MSKIIAIVGRPNVGKSTLFNRITGSKTAIVHHTSGVTRDRNYSEADWQGRKFFLIDTGGFIPDTDSGFNKEIRDQILFAIRESDEVIFTVDANEGIHPVDFEFARLLRKYLNDKRVILVANKSDNNERELSTVEFHKLGLGEPVPVSAISGRNVADLLDILTENISPDELTPDDNRIKFAIIGKPNAGKSSIVNAIVGENRSIVSDIPGTTRDSIDSVIKYYGNEIVLIDTAGLRKKSKLKRSEPLEFYSTIRTYKSISRCDVAILVIDATELMKEFENYPDLRNAPFKLDRQDARIIEDVERLRKGLLIVINKWDLVEKDTHTEKIMKQKIVAHLKSIYYLKFIFISALTGQRIHKVIQTAKEIYDERNRKIKTGELNEKMQQEIKIKPPQSVNGKEIKINYITQIKTSPPLIVFFCNDPKSIKENYKRFLEKKFREHFGFEGVPVSFIFKKKND